MKQVKGSDLPPHLHAEVLRRYVHRFTREYIPNWARKIRPDGNSYKPQFASDREWLENTMFWVRSDGELSERHRYCESNPTWPDGM